MKEIYISVDIEASGPIPGKYSMLSIGSCLVTDRQQKFYVELKPLNSAFIPAAIEVTGKTMADFAANGVLPEVAMESFKEWITKISDGNSPVFVAFNATFDWSFVNWYFHAFLGENPFGISGVDIKAYYMGMTNCLWAQTKSSKIPAQFKGVIAHTHNALDDALEQSEMFELMLKHQSLTHLKKSKSK